MEINLFERLQNHVGPYNIVVRNYCCFVWSVDEVDHLFRLWVTKKSPGYFLLYDRNWNELGYVIKKYSLFQNIVLLLLRKTVKYLHNKDLLKHCSFGNFVDYINTLGD